MLRLGDALQAERSMGHCVQRVESKKGNQRPNNQREAKVTTIA